MNDVLSPQLLERVLSRLGFPHPPEPTHSQLCALYAAWCRKVPFDNVRKLIHLHESRTDPFPGSKPQDFFEAWLQHGTGGTCWSGAGAFHSLLKSLGFDAARAVGTMLVVPGLPPNHGTVRVRLDAKDYLLDCSILHGEPLRLDENAETCVSHPAWGVRCHLRDGKWHVHWRPLHKLDGLDCRLEQFGVPAAEYETRYEQTRPWSPFNYELSARINKDQQVIGIGFGRRVTLLADGSTSSEPISDAERRRWLIEEFGLSEEIVSQLPADRPTPPPPWSKTAATA